MRTTSSIVATLTTGSVTWADRPSGTIVQVITDDPATAHGLQSRGVPMRIQHPRYPGVGFESKWWAVAAVID